MIVIGGLLDGQEVTAVGTRLINPLIDRDGRRFDEIYIYDSIGGEWFVRFSEVRER